SRQDERRRLADEARDDRRDASEEAIHAVACATLNGAGQARDALFEPRGYINAFLQRLLGCRVGECNAANPFRPMFQSVRRPANSFALEQCHSVTLYGRRGLTTACRAPI